MRWCAPKAGSTVFVSQDYYGGTFTLLSNTLAQEGVTVRFVDVPVISSYLLLAAFVFLLITLLVDVSYWVLDPLVRSTLDGS